ncbi:MAG TPA: PIN domain-containing protein [Vicinamibacterales bacterium]|nr:PIN domain-containing protein [Vicinamibacterales bacterium]
MSPKQWKQPPKGVVDTSVLVAGISGFRESPPSISSARLLRDWTESPTFVWLATEDILSEYREVLERLKVRSTARIVALIREQARFVHITKHVEGLPDQDDAAFADCAESGDADFLVTLNPKDFPQSKLGAKVISPDDPLPRRAHRARPRHRRLSSASKK